LATNLEVIDDALKELSVISETQSASPEQGAYCLRKLNEMLEAWTEDGIELGYFAQTLTTADCPIPAWAVRAVKACLAPEIASHYGAKVSQELAVKINDAYLSLLRKTLVEGAEPADMTHMPLGTGHGGDFDVESGW
jgi:hypothetical protein